MSDLRDDRTGYSIDDDDHDEVCGAWNDAHDCRLPVAHLGDHVCAGCHDRWNRGPWDVDCDDDFFIDQRPEEKCWPSVPAL